MEGRWVRQPQGGTSVVFVHGVLSSGDTCWRHRNGTYWPDLLRDSPDLAEVGIYVFSYETGLFSGSYSIGDAVDALKEFMKLDGVSKCRRIVFVCHSMGGIIVRKYLVERAVELTKWGTEFGLFLVASPSLGSSYANLLSPLARAVGHSQAEALRFAEENVWLNDLDKEFKNLKEAGYLPLKGRELEEDKFIVFRSFLRKRVVDTVTGAKYFSDPLRIPGSDHFSIAKPENASALQHRSLVQFIRELLEPEKALRAQVKSGMERERMTENQSRSVPKARVRFVNSPPLAVPKYFEDRIDATRQIADFLRDPAACILTVDGRGGLGKTALVCRVLKNLEQDKLPDDLGDFRVHAVVYINCTRAKLGLFPQLLAGVFQTLEPAVQDELRPIVESPNATVAVAIRALLPHLPSEPTLVLLDNFEDIVSEDDSRIQDAEIGELIGLLSEETKHSLKLIITTRRVPRELAQVNLARQNSITLKDGLESPYGERVLRKLDSDGSVGFRDSNDSILAEVVSVCRGFPRALEAFYSIIRNDPCKDIRTLVTDLHTAANPAERLILVLIGEAYSRLRPVERKIMQAVAIYGRPVSLTGVQYLLAEWPPYEENPDDLRRLVAMHFVRREGNEYYLHPLDGEHALSFLAAEEIQHLSAVAADYYQEKGRLRPDWVTLKDVETHLEQFRLRMIAGDAESAATILDDIAEFLDRRGAFEQIQSLAQSLLNGSEDDDVRKVALHWKAVAFWRIGRASDAVAVEEQLLELIGSSNAAEAFVARGNKLLYESEAGVTQELVDAAVAYASEMEEKYSWHEGNVVAGLSLVANCHGALGNLAEALRYQQRATDLAKRGPNPDTRDGQVHNLGTRYEAQGDIDRAELLYTQALALNEESKNPLWKANHLGALSSCAEARGVLSKAFAYVNEALVIRNEIGDLEGLASNTRDKAVILLASGRPEDAETDAVKAFQLARDLKRPLREYRCTCAEIALAQGNVGEAYAYLAGDDDSSPGAAWDFNNLRGTVFVRQKMREEARSAFEAALAQCDLWLSRSNENASARAGRALALSGLAACGDAERVAEAKEAYRAAIRPETGAGTVAGWRRSLELLRVGGKSDPVDEILQEVFGPEGSQEATTVGSSDKGHVFISYAHADKNWVEELVKVLSPAVRDKTIDVWYDKKIKPGQKWREEIQSALERTRVGLLVVTPDFLASDFINDNELPFLLDAAKAEGVPLLWMYAVPSLVEESPIAALQCTHDYDRPLISLDPAERSLCLVQVAKEILKAFPKAQAEAERSAGGSR